MDITTYEVDIVGNTPFSQGKYHNTEKLPRESPDAFEERTWHLRLHVDDEGFAEIPPMAIKNALSLAAKKLGMSVPCKARRTFTSIFLSGVLVTDPARLNFRLEDCTKQTLFVSSNGKSGQGTSTRVMRHFPTYLGQWRATLTITVTDPAITQEILTEHLQAAGLFVGIGRFRPEVGGHYGMFTVEAVRVVEKAGLAA